METLLPGIILGLWRLFASDQITLLFNELTEKACGERYFPTPCLQFVALNNGAQKLCISLKSVVTYMWALYLDDFNIYKSCFLRSLHCQIVDVYPTLRLLVSDVPQRIYSIMSYHSLLKLLNHVTNPSDAVSFER